MDRWTRKGEKSARRARRRNDNSPESSGIARVAVPTLNSAGGSHCALQNLEVGLVCLSASSTSPCAHRRGTLHAGDIVVQVRPSVKILSKQYDLPRAMVAGCCGLNSLNPLGGHEGISLEIVRCLTRSLVEYYDFILVQDSWAVGSCPATGRGSCQRRRRSANLAMWLFLRCDQRRFGVLICVEYCFQHHGNVALVFSSAGSIVSSIIALSLQPVRPVLIGGACMINYQTREDSVKDIKQPTVPSHPRRTAVPPPSPLILRHRFCPCFESLVNCM